MIKKIWITSFILLLFFLIIKGTIINEVLLNRNSRYTICTVYEVEAAATGSPHARMNYQYKGKMYKGFFEVDKIDKNLIGRRYFIKFYPKNPKISKVLFDIDVSNKFVEIPPDGWDSLPAREGL